MLILAWGLLFVFLSWKASSSSSFFFLSFYQNIQDKHIYKFNDLKLWYLLLKVQMSFIAVIYLFGFILRTRLCVSKYCLLYSQLWSAPLPCSAWSEINTPKPASHSNTFPCIECLEFSFFSPQLVAYFLHFIFERVCIYIMEVLYSFFFVIQKKIWHCGSDSKVRW